MVTIMMMVITEDSDDNIDDDGVAVSAGWLKMVELNKTEQYLQQMTEAGREPTDLEALPELDYEAEESPVPLTDGSPGQGYTFLTELHR